MLGFFMNYVNKNSRRLHLGSVVRFTGETLRHWIMAFSASIQEAERFLTDLDAAIGDGDHGVNMSRGMNAAVERLDTLTSPDISGQLRIISMTLTSSVGGASGPLYGTFFLQCSHATQHKTELSVSTLASAIEAGYRGVVQLGKASVGDKTMVDTLDAAARSLRTSCTHHETLPEAVEACRQAARAGAEGTIPMVAKKGRASYLGERSAGTQDPGSASASLLFDALAQVVSSLSTPAHTNEPNPILL
jgi:dihydroxyacetone kinase-like protein